MLRSRQIIIVAGAAGCGCGGAWWYFTRQPASRTYRTAKIDRCPITARFARPDADPVTSVQVAPRCGQSISFCRLHSPVKRVSSCAHRPGDGSSIAWPAEADLASSVRGVVHSPVIADRDLKRTKELGRALVLRRLDRAHSTYDLAAARCLPRRRFANGRGRGHTQFDLSRTKIRAPVDGSSSSAASTRSTVAPFAGA